MTGNRANQFPSLLLICIAGFTAVIGGCYAQPDKTSIARPSAVAPSLLASPSAAPTAAPAVATPESTAAHEEAIWSQLRSGTGYVVMLRHAIAPGTGDPANFRLADCSTQRNLSAAGRAQATEMGEAFRRQAVPVARVLSSQWCRCLETARLMDLAIVEPFAALNSFFQDASTRTQQTDQVRQLILDPRRPAGVLILVTHQVNITALTEVVPPSGGAVVLRRTQDQQIEIVGQLTF